MITSFIWTGVAASLVLMAPALLTAVRDLHPASFGTWRAFGRLFWGVDGFDEACSLVYTNHLVRLALDAVLDVTDDRLAMFGDLAQGPLATEVQVFSLRFRPS